MSCQPTTLQVLLADIRAGLESADDAVRAAWKQMRIEPERWRCSPWGDASGGFWVVAELPGSVVWYNDIEEGFNTSPFTTRGIIDEYRCDQTDFATFLRSLPEAQIAEQFAERQAAQSLPPAVRGSGRIGRRQTTYWELIPDAGTPVRIHFTDKQEVRFASSSYDRIEFVDTHPILIAYREKWLSLFITDAQHCGPRLIPVLDERLRAATSQWRRAEEYLRHGGRGVLTHGDGLFLRAPESLALIAAEVVRELGARASLIDERRALSRYRAVLLGANFVIAKAFRLGPSPSSSQNCVPRKPYSR